jgi:hypothetical protein
MMRGPQRAGIDLPQKTLSPLASASQHETSALRELVNMTALFVIERTEPPATAPCENRSAEKASCPAG